MKNKQIILLGNYPLILSEYLLFTILTIFSTTIYAQTPPIIYVAGIGTTGDYNCDGNSDQVEINQALDFVAANAAYTTVYLKGANSFVIDEPVIISNNTILTGDLTAQLKLKDFTAWWTFDKPMITQKNRVGWDLYGDISESISNVVIHGFEINGGVQAEPAGNRYNTFIHFTYPNNVSIHDMYFQGGEWDAVRLSSSGGPNQDTPQNSGNTKVYNNLIKECGHDAISFVGIFNCEAYGNKIYRTRTNSGIRATESDGISFHDNIIGNSIGNPSSGYAGIILQNELIGLSTAEIHDNLVYGKNGGIHVGSVVTNNVYPTGSRKNVHVHHNKIYKTNDATAQGSNLLLHGGITINGFHNTLIEHNVIESGTTDGIVYEGQAGGGSGYETIVRNNIIINNAGYGINNKEPSVHTFISSYNLVYNNGLGNYNNTTSTNDINSNPLFGNTHSTLDNWHHIVATYDNTTETFKIYVDGIEKAAKALPGLFGSIGSNSYNLLLGAFYNGSYWYEGRQDELAIWNRGLTATEVSSLYNNGIPVTITGSLTTGIQAYFKMENNWNDSSGNGYNMEDATATFTNNAINGNYAGLFNGSNGGVQYPNSLSTTNGLSIAVWVYRTGLNSQVQTILNKGKQTDNNHVWLYFRKESVMFELGNGTDRFTLEARIIDPLDLDYHIKSIHGRWDGSMWVNDSSNSPCLDAGDPTSSYSNEPSPNGGRVNIGVFGNTSEASRNGPLAIEYLSPLSAFRQEDGVLLKWISAVEVDNNYFDIAQSVDANQWKSIGRIQGQGNSLSPGKYSFLDTHPPTGTIYYRLKQVDFDGSYEYSNIVSVQFLKREILLFPTPTTETINIISLSNLDIKNVIIYNQIGVKVLQVQVKNGVIDVSSLSKGMYIAEIEIGSQSVSKQFIIR